MILLNDNFTTDTSENYSLVPYFSWYTRNAYWTPNELAYRNFTMPSSTPDPPADWWLFDPTLANSLLIPLQYPANLNSRGLILRNLLDSNGDQIRGTEVDCSFTIKYPILRRYLEVTDQIKGTKWIPTNEDGLKTANGTNGLNSKLFSIRIIYRHT